MQTEIRQTAGAVRPRRGALGERSTLRLLFNTVVAMARAFKSVDQYIAAQPDAARPVLNRVRGIIQKALPSAEEVISYQIPAYKLPGGIVLYFAGWKQHYSLYPANDRVVAAFKDELAPYKLSKGTVRFPLSAPVPAKLIERIAKFRAKEVTARSR